MDKPGQDIEVDDLVLFCHAAGDRILWAAEKRLCLKGGNGLFDDLGRHCSLGMPVVEIPQPETELLGIESPRLIVAILDHRGKASPIWCMKELDASGYGELDQLGSLGWGAVWWWCDENLEWIIVRCRHMVRVVVF